MGDLPTRGEARRRARRAAAAVLAAGLLAGCQPGGRAAPTITPLVPPAPSPLATPAPPAAAVTQDTSAAPLPDDAARPDDSAGLDDPARLDERSLAGMLQAIHEVEGEGERAMLAAGAATDATTAFLVATRSLRAQAVHRRILEDATFDPGDRRERGLRPVPEDRRVVAVRVLEVAGDGSCVWLEAEEDLAGVVVDAVRTSVVYYALVRKDPARDPAGANPTPWAIDWQGGHPDRIQVDPPPASRCP